ncbi:MAG: V-type ATP synthase subunit D [Clostridiales bacterium]|nr:V-type ATP synthase subunit D [Clostridiales bacterium]
MAVIPTKNNLINARRSLALANVGYDLMDRKRNILIREITGLIDRAREVQSRIDDTFAQAYESLQAANITLGIDAANAIAGSVPVDDTIAVRYRSVMGVEIPLLSKDDSKPQLYYGFAGSNSMLDEAYIRFIEAKKLARELAELETTIYRLAYAIKKTQKRANALSNIIIPNITGTVKFITDALEEKDREEFVRLKVIKAQK